MFIYSFGFYNHPLCSKIGLEVKDASRFRLSDREIPDFREKLAGASWLNIEVTNAHMRMKLRHLTIQYILTILHHRIGFLAAYLFN